MLAIEPAAGVDPVIEVIENARRSVDLNVYELTSRSVANALRHACQRGVDVRVILELHPYHGARLVEKEKRLLAGSCVQLKGPPPRFTQKYVFDHAKYVVADPRTSPRAELGTANFTYSAFHRNREYLWITSDRTTAQALESIFQGDWNRSPVKEGVRHRLIVSPHSASEMASLIEQPGRVEIEAEELGDQDQVMAALIKKGDQISMILPDHVDSRERSRISQLEKAGVHVRLLHSPYMHAKMIVGNEAGFIGSQNFSRSSLEKNREVGLSIRNAGVQATLHRQFQHDWDNARSS